MNLTKLFEMQRVLDDRIVKEKGLEGQSLVLKKLIALQVELGELMNELPEHFKFWSNKKNDHEKALKEYVDSIHFFLSLGIEVRNSCLQPISYEHGHETVVEQFNQVLTEVTEMVNVVTQNQLLNDEELEFALGSFLILGEMLGFTWEQIEQAYYEKNSINHTRQDTGY